MATAPIDVLVPLGGGSRWQNNEIRFMLRSLERHVSGVRRVYVVGNDPGFLGGDAVHVPHRSDPEVNKEARIAQRVLWACRNLDLSEEFLFANDDHFFCQPCDARTYPHYFDGELGRKAARRRYGPYGRSLRNTDEALTAEWLPTKDFDIHVPMRFDRLGFIGLEFWWQRSAQLRDGFVVKSTYANNHQLAGEQLADCKLIAPTGTQAILAAVASRSVWSIDDSAIHRGVSKYLRTEFPAPCRYEQP